MWIDMFRVNELPPKPAVNIKPKPPEDYEIRVTIWNTEAVPLVENQFLTGEKSSDIYVKGLNTYMISESIILIEKFLVLMKYVNFIVTGGSCTRIHKKQTFIIAR